MAHGSGKQLSSVNVHDAEGELDAGLAAAGEDGDEVCKICNVALSGYLRKSDTVEADDTFVVDEGNAEEVEEGGRDEAPRQCGATTEVKHSPDRHDDRRNLHRSA